MIAHRKPAFWLGLVLLVAVGAGCGGGRDAEKKDPDPVGGGDDPVLEGDLAGGGASCTGEACKEACEKGNGMACTKAGTQLVERGKSADGASFFDKGCNSGDPSACTWAGVMYRDGVGVGVDPAVARTRFEMACEGDDPLGCMILGNMVQDGEGGEANPAAAIDLFKKGCDGGVADACYNLGWHYSQGDVLETDWPHATELFDKACQGGSARGCVGRGTIAVNREDDEVSARELFVRACNMPDNSEAIGCYQAGFFAARGRGGPQDQDAAASYLKKACDAGNAKACKAIGVDP